MPIYEFRCRDCESVEERHMTVATMLASRTNQQCSRCEGAMAKIFSVPALKTDTRFFGGSSDDGFGNDNRSRQMFRKKCAAAGVTVSGKYYGQLCRPGVTLDPFAQASTTGEIKKKLQMLGRGCEGSISVKAPDKQPEPEGPYRVADSIVEREVRNTIIDNKLRPTPKQRREMAETIRNDLTPAM